MKSIAKKIVLSLTLFALMQTAFAQTGSTTATVKLIPVSAPFGSEYDPVEISAGLPSSAIAAATGTSTTLGTATSSAAVAAAGSNGGAWVNSAGGPTIYSPGVYYFLQLNPVGAIPATATITSVNWHWGLSYIPSSYYAYLCWSSTSACISVTGLQTGSTTAFAGLAANQPFIFAWGVVNNGLPFKTDYGALDQVIVNYSY